MHLFTYRVEKIHRVLDADTMELLIDCGFHSFRQERIRLASLNAPEIRTEAGKLAHQFTLAWLEAAGRNLVVQTIRDKREKYGRYLGILTDTATGQTLNNDLLAAGHAQPYDN